jgi:hypothetical protein
VAIGSPSAIPSAAATIPQPSVTGIEVADPAQRVDVAMPTFSNPTQITNPLFPVEAGSSNLYVGTVDGGAFRTEVTVLPTTRIVKWAGQQVETVVSQYNAFVDGLIREIAYDLYAQADDGSVWYFGEDVFNYDEGILADTAGTWLAAGSGVYLSTDSGAKWEKTLASTDGEDQIALRNGRRYVARLARARKPQRAFDHPGVQPRCAAFAEQRHEARFHPARLRGPGEYDEGRLFRRRWRSAAQGLPAGRRKSRQVAAATSTEPCAALRDVPSVGPKSLRGPQHTPAGRSPSGGR